MSYRPSPPRSSSLQASPYARTLSASPAPGYDASLQAPTGKLRVRNVSPVPLATPPPILRSQSAGSPQSASRSPSRPAASRSRMPSEPVIYATPDSYLSPSAVQNEKPGWVETQDMTPTRQGRSRSGSKLLPAHPLRVDVAAASPRSKKLFVDSNERMPEPFRRPGQGPTGIQDHSSPALRQKSHDYTRRTTKSREVSDGQPQQHGRKSTWSTSADTDDYAKVSKASERSITPPRPPRGRSRSGTPSSPSNEGAMGDSLSPRLPQLTVPSTPVRLHAQQGSNSGHRMSSSPSASSQRRDSRVISPRPRSLHSMLEPPPPAHRSISPSASSISTLSDAPTPRAPAQTERRVLAGPLSSMLDRHEDMTVMPSMEHASRAAFISSRSETVMGKPGFAPPQHVAPRSPRTPHSQPSMSHQYKTLPQRKRDSTQRRLSALRGLVGQLDLNQPWSISEESDSHSAAEYDCAYWANGGSEVEEIEEMTESDTGGLSAHASSSMIGISRYPMPHHKSVDRLQDFHGADLAAQDQGWEPVRQADAIAQASPTGSASPGVQKTPPRRGSTDSIASSISSLVSLVSPRRRNSGSRKGSISSTTTAPRRSRLRSESRAKRDTPEPPRPPSRSRKEVFEVASSGFSKSLEITDSDAGVDTSSETTSTTWRSALSTDLIAQQIMKQQGPLELKRQEVMWELYDTEVTFVKSMRTVLRLFATPLKTPHGRWIDGIPSRITELLDALDTITHVHGTLATQLRDQRRLAEQVAIHEFIDKLGDWIYRLEAHEWYLIRFEMATGMIDHAIKDGESVFGEFVRMQSKGEALGNMGLSSMLLKPVQRLTKYPLFFKRLLDVTPQPHSSHSELQSLLASTESIIRRLQAAKEREDDFQHLKLIETRLRGLPAEFELAIRGRKLLGQLQVVRVHAGKARDSPPRQHGLTHYRSRSSLSSTLSSAGPSHDSPSAWDRSNLSPSTARTSAFSTTSSGASVCTPFRSGSLVTSPSAVSPSSMRVRVERSPSTVSTVDSLRSNAVDSIRSPGKKEDVLTMLIFDDMVLVGHVMTEKAGLFAGKKREKLFRVLDAADGGMGKVLDVKDVSGWQEQGSVLALTLIPPNIDAIVTISYAVLSSPKQFDEQTPVLETMGQILKTMRQTIVASDAPLHPGTEDKDASGYSPNDEEAGSDGGDVWKAVRALEAAR